MIGRICIYVIGILCLARPLFATVGGGYNYSDFYYDPVTHELVYVWNDESEAGKDPIIKHQVIDNENQNDKVLGLYKRLTQNIPSSPSIGLDNYDKWEQTRSEICKKYGVELKSVDLEKYDFQYEAIESWGKDMTFDKLNAFINKYTEEEIKGSRMGDLLDEGQRYVTHGAETDDILKTVINISIINKENKVATFLIPAIMGSDHVIVKGLSCPGASFLVIVVRAYFTGDECGYMGDSVYLINDIKITGDSFAKEVNKIEVKISNANLNKTKLSKLFGKVGMEQYQKKRYYAALYLFGQASVIDSSNLQVKEMYDQIVKIQSER